MYQQTILILLLFFSCTLLPGLCETDTNNGAPKVFLDNKMSYGASRAFDFNYIQTETQFIDYVWDRREAELHIMITSQQTASGGYEFEIDFMGHKRFAGLDDRLKGHIHTADSEDRSRDKLLQLLKLGLTRYLAKTPLHEHLSLQYKAPKTTQTSKDPWNSWVFSISANGYLNGQEATRFGYYYGSLSGSRITEAQKVQISVHGSLDENVYELEDHTLISTSHSYGASALLVKAIGSHWSIGAFGGISSSTYNNHELYLSLAPAIEYNLFPYAEATRQQLCFSYRLNAVAVRYRELTLYDKLKETLLRHSLDMSWSIKKPWGSLSGSLYLSQYLHDLSKTNANLYGQIALKIWKGLSLNISGRYARIRDQLSLTKDGASTEDILLRLRQLATNYSYYISFGVSYSFGSIFSNAVNPRFGSNY